MILGDVAAIFNLTKGFLPAGREMPRKGREGSDRSLEPIAGLQRRRRFVRIGPSPPGCCTGEGFGSFGRSPAGLSNRPPTLDRQSDDRKNVGLAVRRHGDRSRYGKHPRLCEGAGNRAERTIGRGDRQRPRQKAGACGRRGGKTDARPHPGQHSGDPSVARWCHRRFRGDGGNDQAFHP